jgi:thiamine-monophosphate kinase
VGAEIEIEALPVSRLLLEQEQQRLALSGGDDYELCFTVPAVRRAEVERISARLALPLTRIGKIVAGQGCIVHDAAGNPLDIEVGGYDHFR